MIEVASYHNQLVSTYQHLIDDKWFLAFSVLVIIDLILDLVKPYIIPSAKKPGFWQNSVLRNTLTYLLVAIAYPYLLLLSPNTEMVAVAFLMAFVYQYLVWIVETWVSMGWWLPAPVVTFVKAKLMENESNLDRKINNKGGKK